MCKRDIVRRVEALKKNKYHTEQNTLSQIEAIERVRKTQSEREKAF